MSGPLCTTEGLSKVQRSRIVRGSTRTIKPSWEGGRRRGPLCLSLPGLEGSPAARLTSGTALQLPGFRERPQQGQGGRKQRRMGARGGGSEQGAGLGPQAPPPASPAPPCPKPSFDAHPQGAGPRSLTSPQSRRGRGSGHFQSFACRGRAAAGEEWSCWRGGQ